MQAVGPAQTLGRARAGQGRWTLMPLLLLRSTGFPFEPLDGVCSPQAADCCDALTRAEGALAAAREEFEATVFPAVLSREQRAGAGKAEFRAWYRLRRAVARGRAGPPEALERVRWRVPEAETWLAGWDSALAALADQRVELERGYRQALAVCRERLRAAAGDPRFEEAVFLSSPSMHTGLVRWRERPPPTRDAHTRNVELHLYGYLQRFCAKNDTTSFFGPVDYADYDPASAAWLELERDPGRMPSRRLTRMAYWAVQALADAVAADAAVRPYLAPRLRDGCALLPGGELHLAAEDRRVRLATAEARMLRLADGCRTVAQLGDALGDGGPAVLERLLARKLLELRPEVPAATPDPLAWLRGLVAELPAACASRDRWLARLEDLAGQVRELPAAPVAAKPARLARLEGGFTALSGRPPRRGGGALFADRMLVYDEARGDVSRCVVGAPLATELARRLGPALDLCASFSVLLQRVCRQRARMLLEELHGGRPLPYLAFARELGERVPLEGCLNDPRIGEYLGLLGATVSARVQGGRALLRRADLEPLLAPVPAGTAVSPDVFLAAASERALAAGSFELVIGEIHWGVQTWTHLLALREPPAAMEAELARALSPRGAPRWSMVHQRRQGKAYPLELPGPAVEVGGRSLKPREQVLPVADLEIAAAGDGVVVRSRSRGQVVELHPGDPRATVNWLGATPPVIAPPLRLGRHTPRVEVAGAVLWRASWQVDGAEVEAARRQRGHQAMASLRALADRLGAPERCFVRLPAERKPVYLDLASPLSVEHLLAVAAGSHQLWLTELLPGPERWWLRGQGGRRSCEWRMTWVWESGDD